LAFLTQANMPSGQSKAKSLHNVILKCHLATLEPRCPDWTTTMSAESINATFDQMPNPKK